MPEALLLGATGLFLAYTGVLSRAGRLRRNRSLGIRVQETLRDDRSWVIAHRAASAPMIVGGLTTSAFSAVLFTAGHRLDTGLYLGLLGLAALVALGAVGFATLRGVRAAREDFLGRQHGDGDDPKRVLDMTRGG